MQVGGVKVSKPLKRKSWLVYVWLRAKPEKDKNVGCVGDRREGEKYRGKDTKWDKKVKQQIFLYR